MTYVYIRTEPSLWTVGHYAPNGKWIAESNHSNTEDAANRVAYLNGDSDYLATINELRCELNTHELIVSEYNATIAAQHDAIQRQQQRIAELEAESNNRRWASLFQETNNKHTEQVGALKQRIAELEFDNVTYKEIIADWQIKLPAEQNDGALYSEGCGL